MSDNLVLKDVWKKNDVIAEGDAISAWKAAAALSPETDLQARAQLLCVVGYYSGRLAALSTCQIEYVPNIREMMAVFSVFVVPEHRQKGFVIPLTYAVHETMSRYALANPKLKIGGTMGIVLVRGTMDKPVTNAGLVLIGYSLQNHPIVLRWFDHFKLDEDAARARDPNKSALSIPR
jgi:hypothetical protein